MRQNTKVLVFIQGSALRRTIFYLVGFLAPMPDSEIVSGYSDVLLFRHHTGSKIMLGPVAFINSSCRETYCYVSNSKRTKVNIRVTKISGIQPGDEITVLYGGESFGPNRLQCECPHKELHGSTELLRSWTWSGRIGVENEVCVTSASSPSSATDCNVVPRLTKRRLNFGVTYKKTRNSGATSKQSRYSAATYKSRSLNKVRYRVNYHQDSSSAISSSAFSETESEAVSCQNDWRPQQSGPCEQASGDEYNLSVGQFDLEADSHFCSAPLQINAVSDFEVEVPAHEQKNSITDSGPLSGSQKWFARDHAALLTALLRNSLQLRILVLFRKGAWYLFSNCSKKFCLLAITCQHTIQ